MKPTTRNLVARKRRANVLTGRKSNVKVLSLIERGGPIRSVVLDHRGIGPRLISIWIAIAAWLAIARPFSSYAVWGFHEAVDHSKYEWARGDVHTNTLEGFFSIFKRGMIGVYQHIDAKHFERYVAEFDFRMNTRAKLGINDVQRTAIAVKGAKGKRLTYQTTGRA